MRINYENNATMKVKFRVYETPQPENMQREPLSHARVQSRGTVRLNEMCEELQDLGVNSAQIKAVLDASQRFIIRSLQFGYNVELEGIGIFSLSLRSKPYEKETGQKMMRVEVDNLNFRCNKKLKEKVRRFELERIKMKQKSTSGLAACKKRTIAYLEKHGYINCVQYAELNNCTIYKARKDLSTFLNEGLLSTSGKGAHKVYILINN